jgi:stress-induced morphogen
MLGTNSSISQGAVMENDKIEVYNYLDMHAVINNSIIELFSIKILQKTFPEMDEFSLKAFEAEWRTARQRMLNLKFDEEDFK